MRLEEEQIELIESDMSATNVQRANPWKLLIVDDDQEVHDATRFALQNVRVLDRPLQLIDAYSAVEAGSILAIQTDIAVILLDVVMESPDAGLQLVQRIRQEFHLDDVRIILRTGQPGSAPELKVIREYDINDYKTKAELTHTRLVTALIAAIRSYEQLRSLRDNRHGLELIVEAAARLLQAQDVAGFAKCTLRQLALLLHQTEDGLICMRDEIAHGVEQDTLRVVAAAGKFSATPGQPADQLNAPDITAVLHECVTRMTHIFMPLHTALYLRCGAHEAVAILPHEKSLAGVARQLLETFAANLTACYGNVIMLERLNFLAYHDPLTQLPNRIRFVNDLDAAGAMAPQGQAACLFDVDRFTDINNALGHEIGDQLLIAIARRLVKALPECRVARIGADRFGLIGPETALNPERLLQVLQEPFPADEQQLQITVTTGFCRISERVCGETLFKHTDIAFNQTRMNPHSLPQYFSPDMAEHTHWRLEVLRHLRRDFRDGWLSVWYQPQVSLADDNIVGLEALARWPATRGFAQPPTVFIPLAEESHLIIDIGAWVLEQSCLTWRRLQATGHAPSRIAVNVSMPQVRMPDFPDKVLHTLERYSMPPAALEIEITESLLLKEPLTVSRNLQALRREGIQITIDDFGTGYSSLNYLRELPADCIKIDRSFVREIDYGRGDLFAETIVTLAHKLGAEVVAEGVDTPEQVTCLRQLGCDIAQGYLYAKPMPAEELANWIGQRRVH
ncbi:MAG: EAL domain-containing protein [Burkholderiales bacterium]|nr:EAL domain-containing protein [Burkholderiales bacterium]